MIDRAYLESVATVLLSHHNVDRIDSGLSDSEIEAIEGRFGFTFPPDLRVMLQFVLPIGSGFPDWRKGLENDLRLRLVRPLDGIIFDVEHNDIWPVEWGLRPTDKSLRFEIVRKLVEGAPKLIPIYVHRFIPVEPNDAGNPVFSVHQTDIIYYGNDLADYLHREFKVPLPDWAARVPRPIRFWDEAVKWRD